ncbi:MAG TPA: radical SAM protein [Candidatus Acidoferrales bacterium]|nr:radical SAM protein [Candidatus Acidoferrales bacterium]
MKICVVTPPSPFLLDERVFPSLGILKVAAALERAGYQVDHLDVTGVSNYEEAVADYMGEAKTFAITATTPQLPAAVRVRDVLKKSRPDCKCILGGPHATLVHAAAKRGNERARKALEGLLERFECVVAGDGEKAIFEALQATGIVDADDPKSALWMNSNDFTESPWPARHLLDMESYHYTVEGLPATSAVFQLGCPFECGFCGGRLSSMLRRIRNRSIDSITAEMRFLHEAYGYDALMAYDDELNVNRFMIPLMRSIADMGIDWRLRGFVKSELFNDEQAEALYAAGFRWLLCGFEAAHPKILRNINKKATLEDNTEMLRTAHRHGLKVKALMSMGHPGESEETILATRDWLLSEKPDDFDCTVITLYPGTPYFDNSVQVSADLYKYEFQGDALYSQDADFTRDLAYYKGKPGEYHAFVWTDHLSRERLAYLRDAVEEDVRSKLGIPYPTAAAAINFEHSMGQGLPARILRSSEGRD